MKKRIIKGLIFALTATLIVSCSNSPTDKIQGVFEVDKESLKSTLKAKLSNENPLAMGLFNVVLENALIEFLIKEDSISGILFLAGETTHLASKIIERNDSLIISSPGGEAYLIATDSGLIYSPIGADMTIKLNKSERTDLSADTKKAIEAQKELIAVKKEFEQNLGKWQKGNYVDEFGDNTKEQFAYCIVRGTSENSISTKSDVFVKTMIENNKISFQIYDSSMSTKESFPDSEFGAIKFKLADGTVKSEKFFYYENSAYEDEAAILFNYILNNDELVKVFIDLSLASSYYSDKYQFEIQQNNLKAILAELKQ
jgi:hypothetical protein